MQLEIPQIRGNETLPELIEYVAKMHKSLQFLLSGKLSTDNIRELSADKVTPGTLTNIPIRLNLTNDAYIQIDLTGIDISNGAILTFEVDELGDVTFRGTINTTKDATFGNIAVTNLNASSSLRINGKDAATIDDAGYSLDYDSTTKVLSLKNGNAATISSVALT